MVEEFSMIFTNEFWPNSQHSSAYFFLTAATYPFFWWSSPARRGCGGVPRSPRGPT